MPPKFRIKCLPAYRSLYDPPAATRTVILIGGRGSAKTRTASAFVTYKAIREKKRVAVLRDEKAQIKDSILAEILARYDTANETGILNRRFRRLETGIQDRLTKKMLIFPKGFRASQKDKRANMKGLQGIDIALLEEIEDLRDPEKYDTLSDGIREQDSIIVLVLNTPDIQHWIVKRFFTTQFVEDGYFQLVPKKIPGVHVIFTTYQDNPHLPEQVRTQYEAYNDPNSATYNPHHYKTAIKGWASAGRKGQVHKKIRPITLEEYLALPYPEIFGQDFGTSRPAGTVGVKVYKNTSWCREINYLPKDKLALAKMYLSLGIGPRDKIVADNADKEAIDKLLVGFSINELSEEDYRVYPKLNQGFNMIRSQKGKDSVRATIDLMDGKDLFAVQESKNLWIEIQNRIYNQNKSGEYTNDPAPGFDHLMDPWGYVLVDTFSTEYGRSQTSKLLSGLLR